MADPARRRPRSDCETEPPDLQVPTCVTGPTGRLRFVLRELRDLLRRPRS